MTILVLNCGSSSIKYQVIAMQPAGHTLLAKGLVERIGLQDGVLTHKVPERETYEYVGAIPDHTKGIDLILSAITSSEHGVLGSLQELSAVGHRVAHGGEYFDKSAIVDADVIRKIESCFELAPLHNPANMKGITAIRTLLPALPQVAVFDTAFHQTMPPRAFHAPHRAAGADQRSPRRNGRHGIVCQIICYLCPRKTLIPKRKPKSL